MTTKVVRLSGSVRSVVLFGLLLTAASAFAQSQDSKSKARSDVPLSSGFTGPSPNRVLPPPAPLPDMEMPDSDSSKVEETLQLYQANEIVYTSKRAQRLADVPMTVSWIPAEELEGTGQFTLCESIQFFPGMECRRGPMRKAAISAHGLGSNFLSNRLLLLKDGRPLTDPWTGIFYPDETTPLTNIKQLEVIRGPGSSLYGSNAFSGVINLIQRTPDDLIKPGNDVGLDARVLGGQYETLRLQATAAGKAGPVKGLVNLYRFTSAGAPVLSDPKLNVVDTQEWSNVNQVSAKALVSALTFDVDYTVSDLGRPGGSQITTVGNCGRCHYTPHDVEHVEQLTASVQADVKVNNNLRVFGEVYTLIKRRQVSLEDQITTELRPSLGKRRRVGGEARALLTVGDLNLTVGGDVKNDLVNNQNIREGLSQKDLTETIFGAFVDGEFKPLPKLAIGGGLRLDYYQIPHTVWRTQTAQISPRASVVYQPVNGLSLRVNYGRAFRAPTFAELAINQQMYAATLLGNSELRAETLDTVEASVDVWPMGGSLRLTGTGFYKKASNFINQEFLFGSTSQFQNIGDARVVGFETGAAAQVKEINSSFDVSYQFLQARSLPFGDRPQGPLDYAPEHRISVRGHTKISQMVFADVYGLYVGSRQDPGHTFNPDGTQGDNVVLPGYLVASARIGVTVVERLSISLIGTNIFNTEYQETNGFPQPKFQLFSEIKFVY